jgi:hypothetical protein
MNQPELCVRAVVRLMRERCALVLAGETRIAEPIGLLQQWEAVHHVSSCELAQRLEVHVSVARMPPPRILGTVHGETHWLCKVEVEHVQSNAVPLNACDEPSVAVA